MTRTVKWLITGLSVSVALNLLVAGFGVASYVRPGGVSPLMRFTMERMMDRLSEDSQQILRNAVAEQREPIGEKMLAVSEGHHSLVMLLGAEELDTIALDEAFAYQRQAGLELQEALQVAIIQVATQLEPEERIKLAQGGERMMQRMMHRNGRATGHPPPPPHK